MQIRYPYFTISLILGAILLPPFATRVALGPGAEPYPAILLPGGGSLTPVGAGVFQYREIEVFGADPERGGRFQPINKFAFLAPIDGSYFMSMAQYWFGLNPNHPRFSHLSEKDRQETCRWFSSRLTAFGFAPSPMKIEMNLVTKDVHNGEIRRKERIFHAMYCVVN